MQLSKGDLNVLQWHWLWLTAIDIEPGTKNKNETKIATHMLFMNKKAASWVRKKNIMRTVGRRSAGWLNSCLII